MMWHFISIGGWYGNSQIGVEISSYNNKVNINKEWTKDCLVFKIKLMKFNLTFVFSTITLKNIFI